MLSGGMLRRRFFKNDASSDCEPAASAAIVRYFTANHDTHTLIVGAGSTPSISHMTASDGSILSTLSLVLRDAELVEAVILSLSKDERKDDLSVGSLACQRIAQLKARRDIELRIDSI
jgi:hypothetical protein